jgi:hypothetical protein
MVKRRIEVLRRALLSHLNCQFGFEFERENQVYLQIRKFNTIRAYLVNPREFELL